MRTVYTQRVISPASRFEVPVLAHHDPASVPGTIPLPATLTIALGDELRLAGQSDAQVDLVSDQPFPWRSSRSLSSFQSRAMDAARADPDQPYYEFTLFSLTPMFEYAVPDRLRAGCVTCHNTHPDTPKRDWNLGDVRGILTITQPLNDLILNAMSIVVVVGAAFVLIMGATLLALALSMWDLRRSSLDLELEVARAFELASRNEELAIEARVASEAKSAFLATMSHELRTPMNAIINYADLAVRRGAKAIKELADPPKGLKQQHRFASEIRTAADRLMVLINQLLDLSRIEAGRMDVHLEQATAAEIESQLTNITRPLMEQNGNSFRTHVDLDLRLHTDVQKLEQCIINLVGNAAKFTQAGEITLEMTRGHDPEMVVVAVTDTGIGMTADQLKMVFEPFSQADSSITRQFGGTGLGLAITKSMIELLGGSITATSEPHKGSTFILRLPRVHPTAPRTVQ